MDTALLIPALGAFSAGIGGLVLYQQVVLRRTIRELKQARDATEEANQVNKRLRASLHRQIRTPLSRILRGHMVPDAWASNPHAGRSRALPEGPSQRPPGEVELESTHRDDLDEQPSDDPRKQVLDIQSGLVWTGGDKRLYAQLATEFVRSYNDKLELLAPKVADRYPEEIYALAHMLKSSAVILGANRLHNIATRLDADIQASGRPEPQALAELAGELKTVIAALRAHVDEASPSATGEFETVQDTRKAPPPNQVSGRGRVMIVDDERVNQELLKESLANEHDLLVVDNGIQAIEIARKAPPPDLIFLDIVMPGMDGYEVCRRLKDDPTTKSIPIVFISGKNSDEDERQGLQLGAIDYIRKPFNAHIVRARARNHLALKRQADMLENLSQVDGLTGIANRRRLDAHLEHAWNLSMRRGTRIALLMMDIDLFKPYNDYYGHAAGDICLRQVAKALDKLCRRKTDLIARYGGEEFAWIIPDTDRQEAVAVAAKVLEGVRDLRIPHERGTASGIISMSIGVAATVPTPGKRLEEFMETADRRLYQAKQSGRDRVVG